MTQSEINKYRAMAALGILEDELNPLFIMNNVATELLVQIVNRHNSERKMMPPHRSRATICLNRVSTHDVSSKNIIVT